MSEQKLFADSLHAFDDSIVVERDSARPAQESELLLRVAPLMSNDLAPDDLVEQLSDWLDGLMRVERIVLVENFAGESANLYAGSHRSISAEAQAACELLMARCIGLTKATVFARADLADLFVRAPDGLLSP